MLTLERRGQIAILILKDQVREDGLQLKGITRDIGNRAKRLGITLEEAREFVHEIAHEVVDEAFRKKQN